MTVDTEKPKEAVKALKKTMVVKKVLKPKHTNNVQPVEILSEVDIPYTPGFNARTNRINTGLTFAEEKLILPSIIGVSAEDASFAEKMLDFYINFSERVPYKGLELDGSFTATFDAEGSPVHIEPANVRDYIWLKMLEGDQTVYQKGSDQHADEYITKFELIDLTEEKRKAEEKFAAGLVAEEEYLKLVKNSDNVQSVKEVLLLLADLSQTSVFDISTMSFTEASMLLKEIMTSQPEMFVKIAKNPNLKTAALVTEAISMSIISMIGDTYYLDGTKSLAGKKSDVIKLLSNEPDLYNKVESLVKDTKQKYLLN